MICPSLQETNELAGNTEGVVPVPVTTYPYARTASLSLLIHLLFFVLAFFMGEVFSTSPPPSPIEIEIEPSRLLDMGSGRLNLTPGSPPPGPRTAIRPKTRAAVKPAPRKADPPKAEPVTKAAASPPAPSEMYPPALPGEAAQGSVAVPVDGRQGAGAGSDTAGGGGAGRAGAGSSPGGGNGDGGYAGAGYRSGALPHYPSAARRAGREGVVLLRVLVGTDGSAASVTVRETSGFDDFDSAAAQAVRKWRFSPARRAGQAVASFHDVRVRFRLEDVR